MIAFHWAFIPSYRKECENDSAHGVACFLDKIHFDLSFLDTKKFLSKKPFFKVTGAFRKIIKRNQTKWLIWQH